MATLEKDELIDLMRHELRLEDEQGICDTILPPVTRRSKYGGLPLNFRSNGDDEEKEDDEEHFRIPLYEEPIHTRDMINEHLQVQIVERITKARVVQGEMELNPSPSLFRRHVVKWPLDEPTTSKKSDVDLYIEENASSQNSKFAEYSRFASSVDAPSRTIIVIIADENGEGGDEARRFTISVTSSARVREVIGYCLLKHESEFGEALEGDVDDYRLMLAEEDGEIETDLPPLDNTKVISQLGFECLGLVRTRRRGDPTIKKIVIVHFIDRLQYAIEVDNMDRPLSWLKDEALKRRDEDVQDDQDDGFLHIREYTIEPADQFDVRLDDNESIGSTGSVEFVMVRKNSSRGDFHPRGVLYGKQMSVMMTLQQASPLPRMSLSPLSECEFDFAVTTPATRSATMADLDGQLSSFSVWRLHNFKPKWKARLIIRWTCLEIEKHSVDRGAFLPQGYQKHTNVPWENVGGVRVVEKFSKPASQDVVWQLTVFWLPVLDNEVVKQVVGDEEWTLRHVVMLYGNDESWKRVTVESTSKNDIDSAASQMNSILQARDTAVHKAFIHSQMGSRPPGISAEFATFDSTERPVLTSPPRNKNKLHTVAKIVRAFRKKSLG